MTVIIFWAVIMAGFAIRAILGSIMAELLDPHEEG
jgi:type III secretory pathway component EscT